MGMVQPPGQTHTLFVFKPQLACEGRLGSGVPDQLFELSPAVASRSPHAFKIFSDPYAMTTRNDGQRARPSRAFCLPPLEPHKCCGGAAIYKSNLLPPQQQQHGGGREEEKKRGEGPHPNPRPKAQKGDGAIGDTDLEN